MQRLRILQIGDLHYDDAAAGPPDVDVKDPGFQSSLLAAAAPPRLRAVMQRLQKVCEHDTPDAAVLCGDLSTRGNLATYRECVAYLEDNLQLSAQRFWPHDHLHAVPGNHDVDRALVDPAGADLFIKFAPLVRVWKDGGTDILACDHVRVTRIGGRSGELLALSLNTCVGAGERRYRAADMTIARRTALEAKAAGGDAKAANALWENLDMPLISEAHLADAVSEIGAARPEALPLIIAHHNLLPQATPRADIYTELFNGGAARTRLSGQGRWVVYLHGHIHDDPVEVVEQRYPNPGQLLSVSAPLFSDGFNLLAVDFGKLGRPLGCTITHYRYERGGDVRPQPEIRVALRRSADAPDALVTRIASIMTAGTSHYFPDLRASFATTGGTGATDDEFCDALREAEWAGLVRIAQRNDEPAQWQIARVLL